MSILSFLFIATAHAQEAAPAASSGIAVLGLNVKFFIAQLINFGILLLIFWKWILPNVTKAMQARTERIEKSLMDADRIEKEKQEFAKWRDTEMSKVRSQASAIVTAAQNDAVKAKQAVVDQTKGEQQKLVDQAKAQIESEKNRSIMEAKSELADLVTNATEKVLRKKLDSHHDQELIKDSLTHVNLEK